jgi:branched-chain amino acid transport system substrate-binding protein
MKLVVFAAAAPLVVYSSLPLQGPAAEQSRAVVNGARLALEEAGGMAGTHAVRYDSLDNSTRRAGSWVPEAVFNNALKAAGDDATVGYIGDFNSGSSAISIPILNEAGIPQISPSNTYIGLTRGGTGTQPGEPDKYYPAGTRTYFRIAPNDRVQGAALAGAMRDRGCRRIASISDGDPYGRGVAAFTRRTARRLGLRIVLAEKLVRNAPRYRALARRVRRARAQCVAYAGITPNGAVPLYRAIARRAPGAKLFGGDGIAERAFVRRRIARRVIMTVNTLPPAALPPAGQDFFRRYSARYGDATPDPYAAYGYESMRLILDAVAAVGPDRRAMVEWLRDVRNRPSPFGPYSFDRFGDTTLRAYGLYTARRKQLIYVGALQAP